MQGVDPAGSLTGQFINAMLQRRIAHEQQAKVLFDRAERAVKQQIPAPGTDDLGPGFESQLILDVIRREAEQEFVTRPPTAAGTNHPS